MSEQTPPPAAMPEGTILAILAAVQVVNVLDFMMVMPMGPEFAVALHIPLSHLGYISGSYTASACIAGLVAATFLDRFDRRSALLFNIVGLIFGTLAGAFATGFGTLLLARVVAGAFGGPATAITLAIVSDIVPPARRGQATGKLMGAFAVASVIGVPAGLAVAQRAGWRAPFVGLAALGACVAALVALLLPPIRMHLDAATKPATPAATLSSLLRPQVFSALALTFVATAASFTLIPNIAGYLQHNMHVPRSSLGGLYFVGGLVSFATTRGTGFIVDKVGPGPVGSFGTVVLCIVVYVTFGREVPLIVPAVFFMLFMFSAGVRNVAFMSLTTKVAAPHERASYQSVQNATNHAASAAGAFISSKMLSERIDGNLEGMSQVAWLSMSLSLAMVPLLLLVASQVARAARKAAASATLEAAAKIVAKT